MIEAFIALCLMSAVLLTSWVGLRYRFLFGWLLVGLGIRVSLLFLGHLGLIVLPYVDSDGAAFTAYALNMSQFGVAEIMASFDYRSAWSYSLVGALLFKAFGYHDLALPALNVLFGTVNIVLPAVIAYKLFGRAAASTAAMLICLYPFTAINSVAPLREEISVLFFVLGLFSLVGWIKSGRLAPLLASIPFFLCASMFHPGWVAVVLGLAIYFVVVSYRDALIMRKGVARGALSLGMGSFVVVVCLGVLWGGVELGKGVEVSMDLDSVGEALSGRFQRTGRGASAYPAFVVAGDPFLQPWLVPLRVVYFLYSPFPWDVRSPVHLFGVIAGVLFGFLTWRAYKSYQLLGASPRGRVLHYMLIMLTFMFAMGVTNSGTAIRHKSKFYVLFVIAAAPTFRRGMVLGGGRREALDIRTGQSFPLPRDLKSDIAPGLRRAP